jgi:hypothetical protein
MDVPGERLCEPQPWQLEGFSVQRKNLTPGDPEAAAFAPLEFLNSYLTDLPGEVTGRKLLQLLVGEFKVNNLVKAAGRRGVREAQNMDGGWPPFPRWVLLSFEANDFGWHLHAC